MDRFYPQDEIDFSRELERDSVTSDGDMVGIYFEGDDGSLILCEMPNDQADRFIEDWNGAIRDSHDLMNQLKGLERRCKEVTDYWRVVQGIARDYLDVCAYEDDTSELRELRKMLWNDEDTAAMREVEGDAGSS